MEEMVMIQYSIELYENELDSIMHEANVNRAALWRTKSILEKLKAKRTELIRKEKM